MRKTTLLKSIFIVAGALIMNVGLYGQTVKITEVMSNSGTGGTSDWFELTNLGTTAVDITGWKVDDNSFAFATALALNGVTSIPAGKSVIFIESAAPVTDIPAFKAFWGASVDNVAVGSYTGSGIGFGSTGDGTIVFKGDATEVDRVSFGAAGAGISFYWSYNQDGTVVNTTPLASEVGTVSGQVSIKSVNALANIASPGNAAIVKMVSIVRITEVMSNSATGGTADWFELTNYGNATADITGWKVDDNSYAFATSLALNGVTSIPAGKSVIFMESAAPETDIPAFKAFWGTSLDNVAVGSYTGSGIGFGSGGDGTIVFKADGTEVSKVDFGAAVAGISFYWSYDKDGLVVDNKIPSVLGTINGSKSNQVTLTSTNALANVASPGTAIVLPLNANVNNPSVYPWVKLGNKLVFETIPSSSIEIYNISGVKFKSYEPAKEVTLDLSKGIYILRVGTFANKIMIN